MRLRLACIAILLIPACRADEVAVEHDVNAVVAGVHQDQQVIELAHEEIPGYMPAMQMPFPVERPELLEGLRMGDQVRFHLTLRNGSALVTGIDRLPSYSGPLPAFDLATMTGETLSSSEFLGKVVVVNFWASWCEPCKVEMPILNQMRQDYPEADFEVVGIAQDPESRDAIAGIVEELGIGYPILLTDGTLETAVGGIPVIPGTLIVDRDGQVVDKRLGLFNEAEIRGIVEGLL